MARIVRNQEKWHVLTIKADGDLNGSTCEFVLVGGARPYLSMHIRDARGRDHHGSIAGPKTLAALGRAIVASTRRRNRG